MLFEHIEPGLEHLHRRCPVFVLAALVLALHDNARWFVQNPHRRACLVDVLAARAACAVKINLQVFLFYLNINVFLKLGEAVNCGKAGVPAFVGVKRAYPDEPMHTDLAR